MVNAANPASWVLGTIENMQEFATKQVKGKSIKFDICPLCDRKGYYKVHRRYEHCRFCGVYRILVPGQDF